jgi:superfamily II DNA or RNA helicase
MTILRPQQLRLLEEIDQEIEGGCRRLMCQAPTGFGKTLVAAMLANTALSRGQRMIFTVPALSLIDQTVDKFHAEGMLGDVGVIQADHPLTNYARPIQVASVQTLQRRAMPPADLVLIDEAHRWYDFYGDWLNNPKWADVPFIGLSATPWTRGLGKHFHKLIIAATTAELIDADYLSKFRVFAPSSPDLEGVRTVAGDYRDDDLAKAMDQTALVADVVDTWIERGGNRPTLCFAVDRTHAKHLQQQFNEADVRAGYIDAYTKDDERKEIKRQFHAGEIKIVCNVGCLTTGVDWDVRCIILARPTKSEMLFVQMIGRGLRTADGKDDCLILDHSDTHIRLGFVTDIRHAELDDGCDPRKAAPQDTVALPKKCPSCSFLKPPKMLMCPSCGFEPAPRCTVEHHEGELVEFTNRQTAIAKTTVQEQVERMNWHGMLTAIAAERGYKPGWIAANYKQKFGGWPPARAVPPIEPTREVLNWVRSRQIAYAKARSAS